MGGQYGLEPHPRRPAQEPAEGRGGLMFLAPDELIALTARKRPAHQIAAIKAMGIPFWADSAKLHGQFR